jgi:ribosomal protein L32
MRKPKLRSCQKCGSQKLTVKWMLAKETWCMPDCGKFEHLHILCPCGFHWAERTVESL